MVGQTDSMKPEDLLDVALTPSERTVLRHGMIEWGGPARCTEEMAVAMGFDGVQHLFEETDRLVMAIDRKEQFTRRDWLRVLLATEIVFASDAVGSGRDWSTTTGLTDLKTIRLLRSIQRKLTGEVRGLLGDGVGTRSRS
jgi:hypothetical protein